MRGGEVVAGERGGQDEHVAASKDVRNRCVSKHNEEMPEACGDTSAHKHDDDDLGDGDGVRRNIFGGNEGAEGGFHLLHWASPRSDGMKRCGRKWKQWTRF